MAEPKADVTEVKSESLSEMMGWETKGVRTRLPGMKRLCQTKITTSFEEIRVKKIRVVKTKGTKTTTINLGDNNVDETSDVEEMDRDGEEVVAVEGKEKTMTNIETSLVVFEKSDHQKVKEILRVFNKYYLQSVQEEEQRCCNADKVVKSSKGSKRGKNSVGEKDEEKQKNTSKRPDLKAMTKMLETKCVLNEAKRFGDIPGIEVGQQFCSRTEMVVVGIHKHWLMGIDYMTATNYKKGEYKYYTFPLATSIVVSGQYEDDLDDSKEIVYTGQGGNNLLGNKRQVSDQVLERGNLALKNNIDQSMPVRVIRGHPYASSFTGKIYTYDGLYDVVNYWAEKGVSGFTVFKYKLKRIEGQPELTTNKVQYVRAQAHRLFAELKGKVCEDISGGQEKLWIPASNLVDDPPVPPTGYTYSNSVQVADGITVPKVTSGCKCKGACTDPNICACAKLNGGDFPYVRLNGGRLIEAKAVVFECGPKCGCGPQCVNRTSQQGLKYQLEVYRTSDKGWAVRSWDFIPAGAPVCEYFGTLMRTSDLDDVVGNVFIFEIDCLQTMKGLDGRLTRPGVVPKHLRTRMDETDDKESESAAEFCINAGTVGGVARFMNHSCEPNVFVQCVLSSTHDIRLARIVFFAADNIPPLQELTYDYGFVLDSVTDAAGKVKVMPCYCGAPGCCKRLH
ncbi:hypothetical protein IFM89_029685 [Coptis chinensis]|uniref:Uncharacterized protein n=1 Tax=Coptis chinensis TaxID=261450 RepID=A0A835IEZ6_9MAGN|nr:hypothetical protein IFM89_029685 [Coptis chinensis]